MSNKNKKVTFVCSYDFVEFLQYCKENTEKICEYIVDDTTMRGRAPSDVVYYGRFSERWDYQSILEAEEIMRKVWDQKESLGDSINDNDFEYGTGE